MTTNHLNLGKGFLIVLGVFMQLISAFVSFHTVNEFGSVYISYTPLLMLFSLIIVLLIELGIRLLGHIIPQLDAQLSKWVFGFFFMGLLIFSAFLTTISPGRIAVKNAAYLPYQQRPEEDLSPLEAALAADQEALNALNAAVKARDGAWITVEERAEKKNLNRRIESAQLLLQNELQERNAKNESIEAKNNSIEADTRATHEYAGFWTQVVLFLTMIGVFLIDQETSHETPRKLARKHQGNSKETFAETYVNTKETGNEHTSIHVQLGENTINEIARLSISDKMTRAEIAEETGYSKGTISKALYAYALDIYNDGSSVSSICDQMDIDRKTLERHINQNKKLKVML